MAENNNNTLYSWDPSIQVVITGKEFETLYNSLAGFLTGFNTPLSIIGLNEAFILLKGKLEQMVQNNQAQVHKPETAVEELPVETHTEQAI